MVPLTSRVACMACSLGSLYTLINYTSQHPCEVEWVGIIMCKGFIDFLRQYLAETQRGGNTQEQELRGEIKCECRRNKYK